MANVFANLSEEERIEKAVKACAEDRSLSARRAAKIYNIAPSTITRRLNHETKSRTLCNESRQLLTPVEERTRMR